MEHSNEPLDPLPAVLPDVDLPCQCGNPHCDGFNFRGATLIGGVYYPTSSGRFGRINLVPWSIVRAALAQPAEVKVYGTQPSELPKTLPAGTVAQRNSKFTWTALETVKWDGEYYCGRWGRADGTESGPCGGFFAHSIDWSTTPIQPAPTREDAAATPSGEARRDSTQPGEPERIDPYVEHRRKLADGFRVTDPEGAVFTKMKSANDWRGNYQREAIRPAKQRKPVEHPAAWPSDCDSEELYVT